MCLSQLANYLVCVDSSKYGAHAKKQTNKMKNGRDDTDVTPPLSLKRTLSLPSVQSDAAIRTQILAEKTPAWSTIVPHRLQQVKHRVHNDALDKIK